jgi:hypothetical protein
MLKFFRMSLIASVMLTSSQLLAQSGGQHPMQHPTFFRSVQVDGRSIFYREAGPKDAPTLLLLHRVPFKFGVKR